MSIELNSDLLKVKDKLSERSYKALQDIHCNDPPTDDDIAEANFVIIYCDIIYYLIEDDLTDMNGFNLFSRINEMRNKRYLLMVIDDIVGPAHHNEQLQCVYSFTTGNCISITRMELKILQQTILKNNRYVTNEEGEIYRINNLEILRGELTPCFMNQPWRLAPCQPLRKRKREEAKRLVSEELFDIKEELSDITYVRLMNLLAGKPTCIPENLENCRYVEICGDEITQHMHPDSGDIFLNVKCNCKRVLKVKKQDGVDLFWNFFSNEQISEIESGYLEVILYKMRSGQSLQILSRDNLNEDDRDLYHITDIRLIN